MQKLFFVANARIPSERAMGAAIMKQCEGFALKGIDTILLVPARKNKKESDPFLYHGVKENFNIKYLWCLDFPLLEFFRLRYPLEKLTFFLSLCFHLFRERDALVYTREPELVAFIPTQNRKFVELHHLYGLRFFGKFILSRYAGLISITHALKEDVVRRFAVASEHIHIAPSGVDIEAFADPLPKETVRAQYSIQGDMPIAAYIGSLERWKGAATFLETSRLLKEIVRFVLVGGREEEVASLKMEFPWVTFLGTLPQRDLPQNQQIADVLIVPNSQHTDISSRYTSPLKVFAHMASGVPIVASRLPSLCEILSEENALLITPDDPEALREGILRVLGDTQFRNSITAQAKQDVIQYDWQKRTDTIISFLKKMKGNDLDTVPMRETLRTYVVMGGCVALFQYVSFFVLFEFFKVGHLTSSSVSFVLTVFVSYVLQKYVTFRSFQRFETLRKRIVSFGLFVFNALFGLFINGAVMYAGVDVFGASAYIIQILSMGILASYNFFVYRMILT